jgi:hypothetical protein
MLLYDIQRGFNLLGFLVRKLPLLVGTLPIRRAMPVAMMMVAKGRPRDDFRCRG